MRTFNIEFMYETSSGKTGMGETSMDICDTNFVDMFNELTQLFRDFVVQSGFDDAYIVRIYEEVER